MPANSSRDSGRVNVLLVGSGGREHALAAALARSPRLGKLLVAPGNPGTEALGRNVPVDSGDNDGLLALARREAVDLAVIGPEVPLVAGLVDRLIEAGIAAFGPTAAAARLEGSKGFTKDLCREFGIPTAAYARFFEAQGAREHLGQAALPAVIKADGLAAGKGVVIATTVAEAEAAIDFMFGGGFGAAGGSVVIEDFLAGEEISFFALCDGRHAVPFGSAQDHKRVGDGDTGPNTGGMGAISPAPAMTPALEARIMREIVEPTLAGMRARGAPFKGVLFAGLMLTETGPQLIEFNVRFGDPETQALLLRLDQDLLPVLLATAEGRLPSRPIRFRPQAAVAVVLAARGYPEAPLKGTEIRRLERAAAMPGVRVFHAGTRREGDRLLADGGRVLTVAALGAEAREARTLAYGAVDAIDWPEGFYRHDIGLRALAVAARGAHRADAETREPCSGPSSGASLSHEESSMPELADLFPDFASRYFSTEAGRIFARVGGSGPPLVLLHGFPQTLAMWHRIAPALSRRFTVVALDLRGYGWSSAPASHGGANYSKRVMGRDVVAVMEAFGAATFAFAGHDRGARVGYRLALDQPGRISKLALLDIVPTVEVWRAIGRGGGTAPHWPFLAEPEPRPESEIAKDPDGYYTGLMRKWAQGNALDRFDPRAMAHYRAGWGDPSRVHASCEDYRAGATLDRQADEADEAAGKTISCPVQVLATTDYLVGSSEEAPLDVWRRGFAPHAEGVVIDSGHFLAEENPDATLAALEAFL